MNLTIVTASVNYSDILKIAYYFNKKKLINQYDYHIITSPNDNDTIEFCKNNGVDCWVTEAFFSKNSSFNKGAALNAFFQNYISSNIDKIEWILKIDSDIILNDTIENFINGITYNNLQNYCIDNIDYNYTDYLYACPRRIYNTPEHFKKSLYYTESKVDFIGYFQLFHVSKIKKDLGVNKHIFYEHHNACRYDDIFRDRYWSNRNQRKILNGFIDHLGPIATNWDGRTSESWSELHKYLS